MGFQILWSEFAENQLDEIYHYYQRKAGKRIAAKLVTGIIEATQALMETPYLGQEEELLKEREIKYRYFVYRNYKIIYSVDDENEWIKIADVFDTRQNPIKIQRAD